MRSRSTRPTCTGPTVRTWGPSAASASETGRPQGKRSCEAGRLDPLGASCVGERMFDAITEKPKPRRWQTAVIIGSAVIHAAAIAGVVVAAMWQVDKLDLTSNVDVT